LRLQDFAAARRHLGRQRRQHLDPKLWVGNASRDDAAVYAIDEERGVVSTTDFFAHRR
jgi:selenophosphate synthase